MSLRADKALLETGDVILLETGDDLLLESEQLAVLPTLIQGPVFVSHSRAEQKVPVTLVDWAGDPVASITAPTIESSKNGAAYAALSDGTWTEISDGDYTITLDSTDTSDLGWLSIRVVKADESTEAKLLVHVGTSPGDWRADYLRTRTLHRNRN